ncbi:hypothetical protein SAMN05444143_1296 [Flavobacterium succinicans]|uniref:Glycosyltransferase subfamily 4-like N-terminal domain-containing protein n=1 Tax=Flavobacterium succinicans TaxID=29536 RepID=A0A1I5A8A1_9FLAO|nr:hypothetical protein [Flavobacterium succinicans]SFN58714.1 hypothetical protein SAMN05444143_1296 [Flavobacterium succinicans]
MIKILNVTLSTEWTEGKQMYMVCGLLKEKKYIQQYILCPENAALVNRCKEDNANYFTYKKNAFKFFNLIVSIVSICKRENISVLHIHGISALSAALAAMNFLSSGFSPFYSFAQFE